MNRFKEIIDDLSKYRSDLLAKDIVPVKGNDDEQREGDRAEGDSKEHLKDTEWHLPYSSDPEPLGEAWAD